MSKSKRIVFVLPGPSKNPVGGYKIVYEYANRLASLDFDVTVIHPTILNSNINFWQYLKKLVIFIVNSIVKPIKPNWFPVDGRVKFKRTLTPKESNVPDADYVFATAWQTAGWVTSYSACKGEKFYLIQGVEAWGVSEDEVAETWRYPMHKIVIARWIQERLQNLGEYSFYLPNGLNFDDFDCDVPVDQRRQKSIAFLYHEAEYKGSSDCIDALKIIKAKYPDVIIKAFGTAERPEIFESWIDYCRLPSPVELRRFYNSVAIYISASHTEGWGLTGCEALQCGTALIATDIGGHREYAIDNVTALLCKLSDPKDLADKIEILIKDDEKRQRLAIQGQKYVERFTWEKSISKLVRLLDISDSVKNRSSQ